MREWYTGVSREFGGRSFISRAMSIGECETPPAAWCALSILAPCQRTMRWKMAVLQGLRSFKTPTIPLCIFLRMPTFLFSCPDVSRPLTISPSCQASHYAVTTQPGPTYLKVLLRKRTTTTTTTTFMVAVKTVAILSPPPAAEEKRQKPGTPLRSVTQENRSQPQWLPSAAKFF